MISPQEIRRKAENLYRPFVKSWLAGESFFPRAIPCSKDLGTDLSAAASAVNAIRDDSKECLGYGYVVEWTEVRSRSLGRNRFPSRIVFQTQSDFLQFIAKSSEFAKLAAIARPILARYPQLAAWVEANCLAIVDDIEDVDAFLGVIDFLRTHPRPNVFVRELPLELDTKFVERHRRVLRECLDRVLPPETIQADEEQFERRFGLRYSEPDVTIRFLDTDAQVRSGCRWERFSLPLSSAAVLSPSVSRAIIVENKVPLLTLPAASNAIALGGLGNAVTDLRYLHWLTSVNVWYWGDIDVEGFEILSRLRSVLPSTRSLMMDDETFVGWRSRLARAGTGRKRDVPPGLTAGEAAAYRVCAKENLRIEQEQLPHSYVITQVMLLSNSGRSDEERVARSIEA